MRKNLGLKKRLRGANEEDRKKILDGLAYKVGFGKPPVATQFKRGNEAGPGRPKGSKNLLTMLKEEAAVPIEVTENGKRCSLPKSQVGFRQLMNKVAQGDIKAIALYLNIERQAGGLQPALAEAPVLDERDLETFASFASFFESPNATESQSSGPPNDGSHDIGLQTDSLNSDGSQERGEK